MSAIVSVYRAFLLGFLFILLVLAVVVSMGVASNTGVDPDTKVIALAVVAAVTLLSVLFIAWSAVVISIHDRHNEIAEGVHRIAVALEARSTEGGSDVG